MRRESSNFVKIKYPPSRKKVEQIIKRYVEDIKEKIGLKLAIVFGSYAKNNFSYGSDVDILLIAQKLPEPAIKRFQILTDPNLPIQIEPFAYTPREYRKMVKENHPILKEALQNGKIIYTTPEYKKMLTKTVSP